MKITPYQYQQEFVDSIEPTFAFEGDGDYFVNSCVSSGKSMMMAMAANSLLPSRTLILISIESLLDQIARHLDMFDEPYSILKAGRESEFDPSKRIQLVMAQTLHARLDKLDLKCHYLIQDEGHREYQSKRTKDILRHSEPLSRLLFSGTCYDSQGFQFEGVKGTFNTVPMIDLIEEGKLSKVKYFTTKWSNAVDYDSVKLTNGEYNSESLEEIISSKSHIAKIITSMNQIDAKNKKTLVFCSSIDQCDLITQSLKDNGYFAEAIHSKVNKNDSESIKNAFRHNTLFAGYKSERQGQTLFTVEEEIARPVMCLVSVNKLGIGFSVEDVQLGVILRPTKIRSLAEQIAGRVYRSHPEKDFGEILDLAQIVKNFGFAHEGYEPPKRTGNRATDKIIIDKINKKFALEKIDILLDETDEPVEVTREAYDAKLKELEEAEKSFLKDKEKFKASIANNLKSTSTTPQDPLMVYARRLSTLIGTTDDFHVLISAGAEFWTLMHGKPISKAGKPYNFNTEWLCEAIDPILAKYPEKNDHWIKAYRTRIKNVCKQGGNYNGIKFFIEYLAEQYELELQASTYSSMPEIDIYDEEIPF